MTIYVMLGIKRIFAGFVAGVLGVLVFGAFYGGDSTRHPGPWQIRVSGSETGFVAVAALATMANGPTAELVARAATKLDVGLPPAVLDQTTSRDRAWRAAVGLARMAYGDDLPPDEQLIQPDLEIAEAWFGRSTGLAYMLAFLDSAPLSETPGSLAGGKLIAATGFVNNHKTLRAVAYIDAKYSAAKEAKADLFLLPGNSYRDAIAEGVVFSTGDGPKVVPLSSPREAIYRLCENGGSGALCEAVAKGAFVPTPPSASSPSWWNALWNRFAAIEFATGPRGIPGNSRGRNG